MNKNVRFDQSIYLILYAKYKSYLVPIGVILACVVIFFILILPQFQDYLDNKDTILADKQTIQTLNQNIQTLELLKQDEITSKLTIADGALPSEKDFTGILNAISLAASLANVSLGDYSFQIGSLFGSTNASGNGQLTLTVSLSISGDLPRAQKFIQLLEGEFPLSEVTSLSFRGNGGSDLNATFFYSPLANVQFNPNTPIQALSPEQQKLMISLSKNFQKPADLAIPKKSDATNSAQLQ